MLFNHCREVEMRPPGLKIAIWVQAWSAFLKPVCTLPGVGAMSLFDEFPEIRLNIVDYCSESPRDRHNAIACVNRLWNLAWRRFQRCVVLNLFLDLRDLLDRNADRVFIMNGYLRLADAAGYNDVEQGFIWVPERPER